MPFVLPWHLDLWALDEPMCNPLHSAAHDRLSDAPREPEMAVGAILPPVLEGHAELILQRELGRTAWLHFLLPMLPEDLQHLIEGLRMNTARVLAIIRLQVLYLLVGHWLPSYDLLVPPALDFCKRSICPQMFQTCGSTALSWSESTINAREGSNDHSKAALPLVPRDRYGSAWAVA
jgi:hypothetical protein